MRRSPRSLSDMKNGRGLGFLLLLSLGTAPLWVSGTSGAGAPTLSQEFDPAALESRLFDLTNEVRQRFGLKQLRGLPELSALARRHSSDMAGRDDLSHVSANGALLEDRLLAGRFYFSAAGENVVQSTSASAEQINRALMRSLEHRKNILDPKYDTMGIGAVVGAGGVLFVTEDFLERLDVLDREPAREQADARIQKIRRDRSLPPLVWDKEADLLARDTAWARAAGRELPPVPSSLGEVDVLSFVSPKFEDLAQRADVIGSPGYSEGGLGVAFGRAEGASGGAYYISLVLFPGVRDLELSDKERGELVRSAINRARQAEGLPELVWRDELAADAAVPKVGDLTTGWRALGRSRREWTFTYETVDLRRLPTDVKIRTCSPQLRRVGVNAAFEKSRAFPRGAFRVTVAVE